MFWIILTALGFVGFGGYALSIFADDSKSAGEKMGKMVQFVIYLFICLLVGAGFSVLFLSGS